MNDIQNKIYKRLARYVAVDTTSNAESTCVPSTDNQISFAHQLAAEMRKIGICDVEVDYGAYSRHNRCQSPRHRIFCPHGHGKRL